MLSYFEIEELLKTLNISPAEILTIMSKEYKKRLKCSEGNLCTIYTLDSHLNNTRKRLAHYPNDQASSYIRGNLHREDGPAVIWNNEDCEWYYNGVLHRLDGPAVMYEGCREEWWVNGLLHRIGGPAIRHTDTKEEWWVNGLLHREDGPAEIRANGTAKWWINGERLDQITELEMYPIEV
jgi:hypothetical protein